MKISGPLPITEETPLTEEEEADKVLARKAGLPVSPQTHDVSEQQVRQPKTPLQSEQPPLSLAVQASALRSNPVQAQSPQTETMLSRPPTACIEKMSQEAEHRQRDSIVHPVFPTTPSPFGSTNDTHWMAAQKKKRRSGFRGVFRKMFNRKGGEGHAIEEDGAGQRGHSYHHSDLGIPSWPYSPRELKTPTPARGAGLPVDDPQRSKSLGQNTPTPKKPITTQASPPHDCPTLDTHRSALGHRRVTLATAPRTSTQRHSLDEARDRISARKEILEKDAFSSPPIGIALTSPTQVAPARHKRRSRSAGALSSFGKDHASLEGSRNAEIKRWKESYMSENAFKPESTKPGERMPSTHTQEPGTEAVNEVSSILVQDHAKKISEAPKKELDLVNEAPATAAPFNFGLSGSEKVQEDPCLNGKPEISNSSFVGQDCALIENRIKHLESAYESLEGSLRRISTRNNRQTIILENVPQTSRTRDRSASTHSMSGSRSHSCSHTSIHQEPIHQASNDTLNPNRPSLVSVPPVSAVHIDDQASREVPHAVYEALNHERAARKALETQVTKLQQDISNLHILVNKFIVSTTKTNSGYPTPSPDALVINSTEDPRADRSLHYRESEVRESIMSKFSQSETDSESDYDEQSLKGYDGIATTDVWATPKEDVFSGSGFFTGDGRMKEYA